jgi:hypothetical protein
MKRCWLLLPVLVLVASGQNDPSWKSKQIPEWSEDDAKQVLTDSPWGKTFTPILKPAENNGSRSPGMGRGGGIGLGGVGLGIPGMGRRGMGNGGGAQNRQSPDASTAEPPQLNLRWESAITIKTAELKSHNPNPPVIDDQHYAIAVYGVPDRMLSGDPQKLGDQLKKEATLKREGRKDFKPSSVQVLDRPDGRIILYLFPMTNEITRQDHRVEFDARIGRLDILESFFTEEMIWQGKLEL